MKYLSGNFLSPLEIGLKLPVRLEILPKITRIDPALCILIQTIVAVGYSFNSIAQI